MVPGPGSRVPITAEISPAVQIPGAMGSLNLRARRVLAVGVHGIVVAHGLDEAGDVGLGGHPA